MGGSVVVSARGRRARGPWRTRRPRHAAATDSGAPQLRGPATTAAARERPTRRCPRSRCRLTGRRFRGGSSEQGGPLSCTLPMGPTRHPISDTQGSGSGSGSGYRSRQSSARLVRAATPRPRAPS
eukprot:5349919-Prymnesium_polylepis.1